jgi:hypothetical protein
LACFLAGFLVGAAGDIIGRGTFRWLSHE